MAQLNEKVFISGDLVAVTGLHIGGSKTVLDIGGIDLNVIKDAGGVPFIPGSSIKGKLRSLLAREHGSKDISEDAGTVVGELFGSVQGREDQAMPSRVIVRDAMLDREHFEKEKDMATGLFRELELDYTEGKWENTIDRKTGAAKKGGLRQLERVPAGARFRFELICNIFDDNKKSDHLREIIKAMRLLEDDYLGGHGSRGYGQVRFEHISITRKNIDDYRKGNNRQEETSVKWIS